MTERKRAELVVRNAGFVESARDEEIANQNRNMESSVNAMNANSQANNAAEANLVAQKVQARAQYETLENKRPTCKCCSILVSVNEKYKDTDNFLPR
jgi:hypothetical protein